MPDHRALYDRIAQGYARMWDDTTVPAGLGPFTGAVGTGVVLDAGCGPGRDLAAFARAGAQAVGVDASAGMVTLARSRGLTACVGDLGRLPFRDGTFGGVWAAASLVHLDDDEAGAALAELRRVTVDGGVARVTVKAEGPGRVGSGEEPVGDGGEVRWFRWWDAGDFAQLARSARWQVRDVGYEDDGVREGLRWVVADLVRAPEGR